MEWSPPTPERGALAAWLRDALKATPPPPRGARLVCMDAAGRPLTREAGVPNEPRCETGAFLLAETLRWGEPYWQLGTDDTVAFAIPVTWNERILGGVMVEGLALTTADAGELRSYAGALVEHLVRTGLLNGALLRENRSGAARERARAEAIHLLKEAGDIDFRRLYSTEEPELLMAMQKGDRPAARRSLNKILLVIYNQAASELATEKRLIGELVLLMQRALLECGLCPESVLLSEFDPFTRLREVDDEETLSEWTRTVLEGLMEASAASTVDHRRARLQLAVRYLREHLDEPLQRDAVARIVGISPAHFSHLLKLFYGRSFSDMLKRMRLEKAVGLLRSTSLDLQSIAAACGFSEQAYFTRVFRKHFGAPPGTWRRRQKNR